MIGENGVPRIGITPYLNRETGEQYIPEGYLQGIQRIGGEPVIIRYETTLDIILPLVCSLDGMLFSGGVDVDPKHYGQKKTPNCGQINAARDQLELALFDMVYEKYVPILGICRGIQLINVAMGGTLIQDIPTSRFGTNHEQARTQPFWHDIDIVPGTQLHKVMGKDTLLTDSYHHQAIDKPAEGLIVSARSAEGVIEAVEAPGPRFLMGVQWHPEKTLNDDEYSIKVFEAFRAAMH